MVEKHLWQIDGASVAAIIGQQASQELAAEITAWHPGRQYLLISDENVGGYYADAVRQQLDRAGFRELAPIRFLPPGEASKNWQQLGQLLEAMLAARPDRQSLVIALGGGVVGDVAGMAAALCLRGLPLVQMPTSLLAAVDSSIGGKTAVNASMGKNLLGCFYQARLVVVDSALLASLPERQWHAGYAEILKIALMRDAALAAELLQSPPELTVGERMDHIISRAIALKAEICIADPREHHLRALLNFGHSFGHALEAMAGYDQRLLHGEAVAIGMMMATTLAEQRGMVTKSYCQQLLAHYQAMGLPHHWPEFLKFDAEQMIALMQGDKKAKNGQLNLILPTGMGKGELTALVNPDEVKAVITQFQPQ